MGCSPGTALGTIAGPRRRKASARYLHVRAAAAVTVSSTTPSGDGRLEPSGGRVEAGTDYHRAELHRLLGKDRRLPGQAEHVTDLEQGHTLGLPIDVELDGLEQPREQLGPKNGLRTVERVLHLDGRGIEAGPLQVPRGQEGGGPGLVVACADQDVMTAADVALAGRQPPRPAGDPGGMVRSMRR